MIISKSKPLVADRCKELWGADFDSGEIAITYGNTVHVASGQLPEFLIDHEATHIRQQLAYDGGPAAWWERYFTDAKFRTDQELAAYRAQYKWALTHLKGQTQRFNMLKHCATALSGPTYGHVMPFMIAMQEIRKGL